MKDKKPFWSPGALLLALSLLLNAAMGFYLVWRADSRRPEKPVAVGGLVSPKPKKQEAEERYSSVLRYDKIPSSLRLSRTSILNTLVERYGYTSYLEIGQGFRRVNFDWIQCLIKIGVDPDRSLKAAYQMTSDEFFRINNDTFDLIFIDGLHHAEQVERDILNALEVLNENGTILVHDCNPITREMQIVPRSQGLWTGDVWKAWVRLRATRPSLKMYVIDADEGCGLIRRGRQDTIRLPESLSYELLDKHRKKWLNLIDGNAFIEDLKRDRF